jgi:hypothetical protein
VGDAITNATVLTLAGKAEAGSTVKVFDGTTAIGTTTATAGGNWTLTTGKLSNAIHSFKVSTTTAAGNTSPAASALSVRVDTAAPAAPKITSFAPDSGTVRDGITHANRLTLTGTAEPGSTVKVFDGGSQIGAATANASGVWSFTTAQLSKATHHFTATATDAAGNTSSASSPLNAKVDAAGASPPPSSSPSSPTPTPSGENPLVKGSFEPNSVRAGEWAGFSGHDGFYQTVAEQSYSLSFDARSRPGLTGSTTTIEVLWNGSFALLPLIFGAIIKIRRNGSLDRFK